jgi:hypothetical protein
VRGIPSPFINLDERGRDTLTPAPFHSYHCGKTYLPNYES